MVCWWRRATLPTLSLQKCSKGRATTWLVTSGRWVSSCTSCWRGGRHSLVHPTIPRKWFSPGSDLEKLIWSQGWVEGGEINHFKLCNNSTRFHFQFWRTVSAEVKELLRHMLHIVPQKRPTAAQILRHPWLWQPPAPPQLQIVDNSHMKVNYQSNSAISVDGMAPQQQQSQQQQNPTRSYHQPHNQQIHPEQTAALRGAVNATFRAIASPQAANVGPVGMSELARRRAKDKVTHTHLWDAESGDCGMKPLALFYHELHQRMPVLEGDEDEIE